MHEINLNYVYLAGKTLCLGYKNESVNVVHFTTFLKSKLNYCAHHHLDKQQRSDGNGKD
jgi:hypothetical protein